MRFWLILHPGSTSKQTNNTTNVTTALLLLLLLSKGSRADHSGIIARHNCFLFPSFSLPFSFLLASF